MNSLKDSFATLSDRLAPIWRYRVLLFFVFVAGLCGYVLLQVNQATVAPPVGQTNDSRPATPHLDPAVVQKLKQLQDNSVSVKALFNQGRDNPFQ